MYIQSCVCINTETDASSYGRTGAFLSWCLTADQYFIGSCTMSMLWIDVTKPVLGIFFFLKDLKVGRLYSC